MKELFAGILNISISAGILIVVCVLVRLIFRKMPKFVRCLMWLLVAVRLAIPFNIESPFSLQPAREYVTVAAKNEEAASVEAGEAASVEAGEAASVEVGKEASVEDGKATDELKDKTTGAVTAGTANEINGEVTGDMNVSSASTADEAGLTFHIDIMNILSIIWVIGVAAVLAYAIIAYIRLRRSVADAVLMKKNIYQSERVGTAFVLGIISPKIYVPYGLSKLELYMTINHERAHLARRDHLVKPLGFIITAVYWFNPLVWLAYILLCKDIELACDEKVIKKIGYDKKKEYSQTLLNMSIPRKYISACPVAFGEIGINERIKNVLNMKKGKKIIIAAAVAICAIIAVCFLTYPRNKKATAPDVAEAGITEETTDVEQTAISEQTTAEETAAGEKTLAAEESTTTVESTTAVENTPAKEAAEGATEEADETTEVAEESTADEDSEVKKVKLVVVSKNSISEEDAGEGKEVQLKVEGNGTDEEGDKVVTIYKEKGDPSIDEVIPVEYIYEDSDNSETVHVIEIEDVDIDPDAEICFPVIGSGIITRQFSDDHPGTDISAEEGTSVVSVYDGTVEDVGFNDNEGNYIIIKNSQGWTVKYSHLKDAPSFSKGDSVETGALIGAVGSTGKSTGPHLHLGIIDDKGQPVDPMTVI